MGSTWRLNDSENHMQRHLQETRAPDRVLDHAQASMGREGITRRRIVARVKRDVVVGRVKAGMVENVECIELVLHGESLGDLRHLHGREVETGLERATEDVASAIGEQAL